MCESRRKRIDVSLQNGVTVVSAPLILNTIGEIARLLGVPIHRIRHVLATRPHIQAAARAGGLRVFDNDAVAQIRHELTAIDARRREQRERKTNFPKVRD